MSMNWIIRSADAEHTEKIGELLGSIIKPPELIELRSDLGGGKTTFTKGLVCGLGSTDRAASPTFTLNKVYEANHAQVHHFDFYRLDEPGILSDQLQESLRDSQVIIVIEWADIVKGVLPEEKITIEFKPVADNENERVITFEFPSSKMEIIEKLRTKLTEVEP
jgi:tRNA threonylcarbamoyladenosine biosynthesis protein TsaE